MIPLNFIAALMRKHFQLIGMLDALGDDLEAQACLLYTSGRRHEFHFPDVQARQEVRHGFAEMRSG